MLVAALLKRFISSKLYSSVIKPCLRGHLFKNSICLFIFWIRIFLIALALCFYWQERYFLAQKPGVIKNNWRYKVHGLNYQIPFYSQPKRNIAKLNEERNQISTKVPCCRTTDRQRCESNIPYGPVWLAFAWLWWVCTELFTLTCLKGIATSLISLYLIKNI